tara:strand:+ start:225 stop:617 length:393 start_codon:yes stop_codon:yes gene_type:complete
MEAPEFKSDEEFFAWTFKKISESLTNLAKRVEQVEEGLGKIPPPGADMVKYKPPGSPAYLNLKELLDLIFKVMNDHEKRFPESADWALDVQDKMKAEIQMQVYREIDEKIADKYEALEARLNIIEDKLSE